MARRKHSYARRFFLGLGALFLALLLLQTGSTGSLGRVFARMSIGLLGSVGVALVALGLLVLAFYCIVPTRIRAWLWSAFEAMTESATSEPPARAARARVSSTPQRLIITHEVHPVRRLVEVAPTGVRVIAPAEEAQVLPPAARMKLDDVRGALKQLGYRSYEYEPLVASMDANVSLELLVRGALKTLQRPRA